MNTEAANPYELDDEEFDALEALLASDAVPDDCMNLEMLDGYLAAVVASPVVLTQEDWLPGVWTAHSDGVAFGSASAMQQAIRLVLQYYNELATSIGAPEGWEPFCYATSESDDLEIGEEWMEGFAQGLELWPPDWRTRVPSSEADAVCAQLDALIAPWEQSADEDVVDAETRLRWLENARVTLGEIVSRWRALDLPAPQPVSIESPAWPAAAGPRRNDACPCGSGKKYKKCCGSE